MVMAEVSNNKILPPKKIDNSYLSETTFKNYLGRGNMIE